MTDFYIGVWTGAAVMTFTDAILNAYLASIGYEKEYNQFETGVGLFFGVLFVVLAMLTYTGRIL